MMSLSTKSNTINALGIFGRHTTELENYFGRLSYKYSRYPENDDAIGIFNHLSLVIGRDVPIGRLPNYIDLLRELKPYLPLKLKVKGVIIKEDRHIALAFDINQTEGIRHLASTLVPEFVVTTGYTKVVWYVPKNKQPEVETELKKVNEMVVNDFILVANRQDDEHTIYSSNRYHMIPATTGSENTDKQELMDALYTKAGRLVVKHQKASVIWLQKKLLIDMFRAETLLKQLEANGVVGAEDELGERKILVEA